LKYKSGKQNAEMILHISDFCSGPFVVSENGY